MGAGVIFTSFFKALSQLGDARFRRVLALGVLLSLALLAATSMAFLWVIEQIVPATVTLPLLGPIGGIATMAGWGTILVMLGLSVFMMVPVASAFSGIFLEDIARAVEDRHYPDLPPAPPLRLADTALDSLRFLGLLIVANLLALGVYVFAGPFAPALFWAMNGWLLGREYFTLVAMRRLGREAAQALRGQHAGLIWLAGSLMAAPLSLPFVNLLVPVLGVATFTHIFHSLSATDKRAAQFRM